MFDSYRAIQQPVRIDLMTFFLSYVTGCGEQEEREKRSRWAASADGVRQRESAHRGEDHTEENDK